MLHLGSTQTMLFVDLVKEAEKRAKIPLTENQESYTVFMLMRFMRRCEFLSISLATTYLESFLETPAMQECALTDTADAALLFAGLFPERAKKLNVSSSYFMYMSEMCFNSISDICGRLGRKGEADLYKELALSVQKLAQVLYCTRAIHNPNVTLFSKEIPLVLH